jgi:tetratricopeptide (TPR) repeat protein
MLTAFLIAVIIGFIFIVVIAVSMVKAETEKQKKNKPVLVADQRVREMMASDSIKPRSLSKKTEAEYERLKREVYGEEGYRKDKESSKQTERNLLAVELEKEGRIEEAIGLLEQNVQGGFDGEYPYWRLAVLYRKRGQFDDEIRVIKRAIPVLNKDEQRAYFKKRLEKALILKSKKGPEIVRGD